MDLTVKASPDLLDGEAENRGQGQEGSFLTPDEQGQIWQRMRQEHVTALRKRYEYLVPKHRCKITDDDLILLDADESPFASLQTRQLASQIWDEKIDIESSHEKSNRLFEERRHKMREEKLQKNKKHASYELGAREFTLTYSPRWFNDDEARCEMKKAIEKLVKYYKDEIVQLRAIGEVGSNGLSHVHCFYKLSGGLKITDKNFKRAWKFWDTKIKQGPTGHQGGHHATVRHESDFAGYIEKDIDTAWLDIVYPSIL